jgi:hypothetical protein
VTRFALLLSMGLGVSAEAASVRWENSREASACLQPARVEILNVQGVPARRIDAERLHSLKGTGERPAERLSVSAEIEPAEKALQILLQQGLHEALRLDDGVVEADMPTQARDARRSLPVTNPTRREQCANPAGMACPMTRGSLRYFGADNRSRDAPLRQRIGRIRFDLPGETSFALSRSAS